MTRLMRPRSSTIRSNSIKTLPLVHRWKRTRRAGAYWRGCLGAALLAGAAALTVVTASPAAADRDHGRTNVVRIVQTSGGPVIANSAGMTLYVFVNDLLTTAPSACIGDCRNDWPPTDAGAGQGARGRRH